MATAPNASTAGQISARAGGDGAAKPLTKAVHRSASPWTREGMQERLFTFLFDGLVYAQIWEDPVVDMAALQLGPEKRVIAIASGGCNAMSYLIDDPKEVIAVDLNAAHVALVKLKRAGILHLPHYQAYFRFFGAADDPDNPRLYHRFLKDRVDPATQAYWGRRDVLLRPRISLFRRNIYRYGLLGRFIMLSHWAARFFGVRLAPLLDARDTAEQRAFFEQELAPLFDRGLLRWITANKASLFGLGIPPAQYESLAAAGDGDMAVVLKRRLEKLVCDFPFKDNYFAWQAFARSYARGTDGPLPPYLDGAHYETIKARAERLSVENISLTERLKREPDAALDGYVLLDAQDWMTDAQLNDIWQEITRTARPGARVIFRTADLPSLLPGRVEDAILKRWRYEEAASKTFTEQDRSAIYGGFHLYVFEG